MEREESTMEYSVVGKSLPRPDAFAKALGQAQYVNDRVLPRMLYGKVLHSPHPHARILNTYNSTAPLMITGAAFFMTMPYLVRNFRFESYHVYTNKPVGGAMRGHGLPQVRFACDSSLDMVAQDAGLDPVDIRRRNALHANADNPLRLNILTRGLDEAIQKTEDSMRWKERWGKLPRGRGIGFACSGCASGISNMSHIGSGAIVKVQQDDGSVSLLTGAADIGQGAESVLCQIVAEVLGVSMDHMRVTAADTELTPLDPGTFGSGVTLRAGNAARLAAVDARRQIAEVLADKLEANPDDLVFKDERVFVKGSPERGFSWNGAIKAVQYADKDMPVVGHGFYRPEAVEPTTLLTQDGNISPAYSFMAQGAEVLVDMETGLINVASITTGHDCGRAINPMAVEGQLDGSAMGGTGQAIYENLDWDAGSIRNPNFLDYKLPTALDAPAAVSMPIETNDPNGPFGAKEAGEGTQIPTAAAIANAVFNAVGVRVRELPITPEKVLAGLQQRRTQG